MNLLSYLPRNTIDKKASENKTTPIENEMTPKNDESLPNDEQEGLEDLSLPPTHLDALTVSLAIADSAACSQKCQLYHNLYKTLNNKVILFLLLV